MNDPNLEALLSHPDLNQAFPDSRKTATESAPMVLIVEDDEDIAFSLTIRLGTQGMNTCVAGDAITALDVARENEPDVAILDINMPGGNGFDVAEKLRADPRSIGLPIIFLTASMRPDLRERAEGLDATEFMTKPYDAKTLMETVARLVEGGRFQR